MVVAVQVEPRAGWSAMLHHPEAGDSVPCVEHICHVDEEESPFLLIVPLIKEGAGGVDCALDSGL